MDVLAAAEDQKAARAQAGELVRRMLESLR